MDVRLEPIDAIHDERLSDYQAVADPEWLNARGLFVAEGRQTVELLLAHPTLRARSVLVTPRALAAVRPALERARSDLRVLELDAGLLRELGGVKFHQGCLAVGERPRDRQLEQVQLAEARLVVVLERLSDPDNVGSVFRNAAAFGVDLVVLSPGCSHPLYRKSIRTSTGAVLSVPWAEAGDWPTDLERLKRAGLSLLALSPAEGGTELAALARPPERVALLLGSEGHGLSTAALECADLHVRIPMRPGVDSLNVATASGIALHQLAACLY